MILTTICDLSDYIIPGISILLGIVNRIVFVFLLGNSLKEILICFLNAVSIALSLTLLTLFMNKVLQKEAMGQGDLLLVLMLGTYCNLYKSLFAIVIACILALFFFLIQRNKEDKIAFGPFLCLGYFLIFVWF